MPRGTCDGEPDPYDVYENAALTTRIPDCDVVATEKLCAHLCQACGVAARYKCEVVSSVFDAAPLLA